MSQCLVTFASPASCWALLAAGNKNQVSWKHTQHVDRLPKVTYRCLICPCYPRKVLWAGVANNDDAIVQGIHLTINGIAAGLRTTDSAGSGHPSNALPSLVQLLLNPSDTGLEFTARAS